MLLHTTFQMCVKILPIKIKPVWAYLPSLLTLFPFHSLSSLVAFQSSQHIMDLLARITFHTVTCLLGLPTTGLNYAHPAHPSECSPKHHNFRGASTTHAWPTLHKIIGFIVLRGQSCFPSEHYLSWGFKSHCPVCLLIHSHGEPLLCAICENMPFLIHK